MEQLAEQGVASSAIIPITHGTSFLVFFCHLVMLDNDLIVFHLPCHDESYLNCATLSVGLSVSHSFVRIHHTYIKALLLAV